MTILVKLFLWNGHKKQYGGNIYPPNTGKNSLCVRHFKDSLRKK